MADLTGTTLGKYQLQERLGRGGMAEVYKAYHPNLNRHVALKILHAHLADAPDFMGRFRREAQAVAQLHHPHIVQVFDFDSEGDAQYMVMEYVPGQSLKGLLDDLYQRGERLPLEEVLRLFRALLDAVGYAHSQGMIHRDLKPANVMLAQTEDDRRQTEAASPSAVHHPPSSPRPVLMDFGIAKIVGAQKFTASGVTVGTPTYMSPEQGHGHPGDERSDLYALGVMLYECLTGLAPYDGDSSIAVMLKHISAPIPALREVRPDLPDALERVVTRALAKDPAERFQSAREFDDALSAIEFSSAAPTATLRGLPSVEREVTTAPPASAPLPAKRGWPLGRAVTGSIVLAVLVLAALAFLPSLFGPSPALARGQQLLSVGNYQLAADAFTDVLTTQPTSIEALVGRAQAYEALGRSDEALADIEQVVQFAPQRTIGYQERARLTLLYFPADPQMVLADLSQAVQLARGPEIARTLYLRGWAILNFPLIDGQPNPSAALDDLRQAVAQEPRYAEAQVTLAQALLRAGQPGAALDPINRAVELQPGSALNYRLRAHIYFSLPDAVAAKDDLSAALQYETDAVALATLYAERAYLSWRAGQGEEARADVAQALARQPESLLAQIMRAMLDGAKPPAEPLAQARALAPSDDPIWQAIVAGP